MKKKLKFSDSIIFISAPGISPKELLRLEKLYKNSDLVVTNYEIDIIRVNFAGSNDNRTLLVEAEGVPFSEIVRLTKKINKKRSFKKKDKEIFVNYEIKVKHSPWVATKKKKK
jgi:hypothetical protein